MNKFLTVFLSLALLLAGFSPNSLMAMPLQDPGTEEIDLATSNDPGDDRGGIVPVRAYLSFPNISIVLDSTVGVATVIVKDAIGAIVYLDVINAPLVDFTQFAAPTTPGTYKLEIQSLTYYGIGTFSI